MIAGYENKNLRLLAGGLSHDIYAQICAQCLYKMDAMEQNDYDVFRRDAYRVAVASESPQNRRIVRSVEQDEDDEDFDDLEALRLAALRSLGSKNSYTKSNLTTGDVGSNRRVSLGRGDNSDLQIITVERQDSFSSTSSDYEEIDLSAPSDVAINQDKRTFADSDESNSDSDIDNAESEDKFISDSKREEGRTVLGYEEEEGEDSVTGFDGYDDVNISDDDVVENTEILSDSNEIENNFGNNDEDDIEKHIADQDEDDDDNNDIESDNDLSEDNADENDSDLYDEDYFENMSDKDIADVGQNSPSGSEILEDDLLDSDNEIKIINDISITIANESLIANDAEEHLEIVNNEEQESDGKLGCESDGEQINDENLISPQRIIVSHSDSEDEKGTEVKNETEKLQQNTMKSKLLTADKNDEKDSAVTSVTASLKTADTQGLSKRKEHCAQDVKKTADAGVKPSSTTVKKEVKTMEKPKLASTCTSKPEKDGNQSQTVMPKVKTVEKDKEKEIVNVIEKAQIPLKSGATKAQVIKKDVNIAASKDDRAVASKDGKIVAAKDDKAVTAKDGRIVASNDGKIVASKDGKIVAAKDDKAVAAKDDKIVASKAKETKASLIKNEEEEEMDFDQLSIEDEDIDFDEEEKNLPAVKSKVGLNKIPTERSRTQRHSLRENKERRYSYSPVRSRTSLHSHRNRSPSHERLRDRRLYQTDRSRERSHRRSLSPRSRARTYRGCYGRTERNRSRDRIQSRPSSFVTKNRESRHYRSRSRSRSVSQTRRRGAEKDLKSKSQVAKKTTKESVKASVSERLEIKKKKSSRSSSRSPRKELRTQNNVANKKTIKAKESKPTGDLLVANGTKVEPRLGTVNSTKDLRSRLSEKKVDQDVKKRQKSAKKEPVSADKEKALDARIQRIKQQNEAILKRAKEIQAEKIKFS